MIPPAIESSRPEARMVFLSVNPKAGANSGEKTVDALRSALEQADYRVIEEEQIDQLVEKVHLAHGEGNLRGVIAGGGDGTAAFLANRLDPDIPLALLPLGTENLLSKYLGLNARPADVCRLIDEGLTVRLDAGRVGDRLFLLMLSCGFDADVVRRAHEVRSGHITRLAYIKPIMQSVRSYEYPTIRVYCEGESDASEVQEKVIEARWAFIVNVPRYAMGLRLVPGADPNDGLFDVCTFRGGGLLRGIGYFAGVVSGRHLSGKDCNTVQASRIRIESDSAVPYQVDGDPGGHLPIDVEIVPQRIRVFVTRAWAQQNGIALPSHRET